MTTNNLEDKVMTEIKSGRVKLRSKYIFLAEKLGLGSALALTVVLAAVILSVTAFYLNASESMWYLGFGHRGLGAFLESFPYQLVLAVVGLVLIAGIILKKTSFAYNKPFGYISAILIAVVIIGGTVLGFTGLSRRMEDRAFSGRGAGQMFRPMFSPAFDERERGMAGVVSSITSSSLDIQTPRGIKSVNIAHLSQPLPDNMATGTFVVVVGKNEDKAFEAEAVRVVDQNAAPMIQRGIKRFKDGRIPGMMPPVPGLPALLDNANTPPSNCNCPCMAK